jgi:hypothetical protein
MEATIKEKAHKIYKEAIMHCDKMRREEPFFSDMPFFYNRIGIDNKMQILYDHTRIEIDNKMRMLHDHIQNLLYIFCRQEVLKEDNNTKSKLAFYLAWHIFMLNYKTKMYIKKHKEYIIKEAHEKIKRSSHREMYFYKVINFYDINKKFINDQDALDDFVDQNRNCYYRSKEEDLILKRKKEPFLYFAIKSFYKDLHLYEEGLIKKHLDNFKEIKNELFRICEIDNKVSNFSYSYDYDTIEVGEFASNIYIAESKLYDFFRNLNLDYYLKFKFISDKQTITCFMPILEKQYSCEFMLDEETIESKIYCGEGRYKFRSKPLF